MTKNVLITLIAVVSLVIGGSITALWGFNAIMYLFGFGGFGAVLVRGIVHFRHKSYVGAFFTTFNGLHLKLTTYEFYFAVFFLSIMASPFVFMLLVSTWR